MLKMIKIQRERILPNPGRILVDKGSEVESNTVIGKLDYVPGRIYRVPVAAALSLPRNKISDAMIVKEGEHVKKGQPLAINQVFGKPFVSVSPLEGIVGIISRYLGMVYIRDYLPLDNTQEDDIVYDLNKMFPEEQKGFAGKMSQVFEPVKKQKPEKASKIIEQKILVTPGARITPSQIIFYLDNKRQIVSSTYGVVKSTADNIIRISTIKIQSDMSAYIPGVVVDTNHMDRVTVEGEVFQLQGAYGLGSERQGRFRYLELDRPMEEGDLQAAWKGEIIFVPKGLTLAALQKADHMGIAAIVTSHMSFMDVEEYAGAGFVPGITGNEVINCGLLLVKGFIKQDIEPFALEQLKRYDGQWVSFNGTTHIRAGAIRPELIFNPLSAEEGCMESGGELFENMHVEIVRSGKYHGKRGIITKIHDQPVTLPSQVRTLAATVMVDNQEVIIPLTNLMAVRRRENE